MGLTSRLTHFEILALVIEHAELGTLQRWSHFLSTQQVCKVGIFNLRFVEVETEDQRDWSTSLGSCKWTRSAQPFPPSHVSTFQWLKRHPPHPLQVVQPGQVCRLLLRHEIQGRLVGLGNPLVLLFLNPQRGFSSSKCFPVFSSVLLL